MNEIELKLRENRRKRMNEEKLLEGYYLVSYNYDGDELSDYRGTLLVRANSEEEALKKARSKKSDGRHFEIDRSHKDFPDGYVDSQETWKSKYPKSNYGIIESKEDDSIIRAEHTPVSTANKPQINEAFVESEAILQGLTKVRTEAREAHSKYVNMNDLAECKAILTYLVKDSKALLDLVTDALSGNSVDESKLTEGKWGIETDILDDIEAIILGKKSVDDSTLKDAEFMIGAGGEGMIYLPDVDTFDIKVSPRRGAVKIENKETESQINEASWDDEEDENYDDFEDESDVRASNWKRLKDLQGDFWTNLDELVEDIEDKLGYEVVFKSREYLSVIDPEAEDDAEYKLTLGGTERTIVVELDSSYPM